MVEHHLDMVGVVGSIPIVPTKITEPYAVEAGSIDSVEKLVKLTNELSQKLGDEVMTLADRLRDEGIVKGQAKRHI